MDHLDPAQEDSRRELAVATRAALRSLPSLYAVKNAGVVPDAEVFAAEMLCLIGLHEALNLSPESGVQREQLKALAGRVIDELLEAPSEWLVHPTLNAAYSITQSWLSGASSSLTSAATESAWSAMQPLDRELADSLRHQATLDRMALNQSDRTVAALVLLPLCSEADTARLRELLQDAEFGRKRLRGWYGSVLKGDGHLISDLPNLIPAVLDSLSVDHAIPHRPALFNCADVIDQWKPPAEASEHGPEDRHDPFSAELPQTGPVPPPLLLYPYADRPETPPENVGERYVNSGFALLEYPDLPLHNREPLSRGETYLYWLEVGAIITGSIETSPTPIDIEILPPEARLTVVLFGFGDGLEIFSGTGELRLSEDGTFRVERQPEGPASPFPIPADLLEKRLFFLVRTPRATELASVRLRCNIYCKQVLVQSRLVIAKLYDRCEFVDGALTSTLDYSLTRSLRADVLDTLEEHRLSVMLNDGGNGSHQFRFFGMGGIPFVSEAHFGESELADLLAQSRAALRQTSWGSDLEWAQQPYRYASAVGVDELARDLINLAVKGYRLYDTLIYRLSNGKAPELAELMRQPGLIQISGRRSARELVPAALIYDQPLNTQAEDIRLCPAFRDALASHRPLHKEACFQGNCPHHGDEAVVCPSGFWGYRHHLGFPVSLATDGIDLDAGSIIPLRSEPAIDCCFSIDPEFVLRDDHLKCLRKLFPNGWSEGGSFDAVRQLLSGSTSQIIYFYCHGGLKGTVPYILVGDGPGITRDNIRAFKWNWRASRPLVFMNGCHTSALEPSHALDLVTGFIETAGASGVVGTEITIFEPLACAFAEAFIEAFVHRKMAMGKATRSARLKLLEDGCPLGLVYIPFALASLRLDDYAQSGISLTPRDG
jgi:hypothetical protein